MIATRYSRNSIALQSDLDRRGSMNAWIRIRSKRSKWYSAAARDAFDITREPEATRGRFGDHLWCQEALLARRLVEAGASFVTLDLSYHRAVRNMGHARR